MYKIKRFLENKFERINAIIDNEYNTITKYACMIGSANYPFPSVMDAMSPAIPTKPE